MSCQAKSKPRAVVTRVGALFACLHAPLEALQSGTIVANPRLRRGATVASSCCAGWHSSNPSLCWLPLDIVERQPQTRFCRRRSRRLHRDRSQLRKDRAATDSPTFVVLDLWLRDAHSVQFPVDVVPSQRQCFRRCPQPTVATRHHLLPTLYRVAGLRLLPRRFM